MTQERIQRPAGAGEDTSEETAAGFAVPDLDGAIKDAQTTQARIEAQRAQRGVIQRAKEAVARSKAARARAKARGGCVC